MVPFLRAGHLLIIIVYDKSGTLCKITVIVKYYRIMTMYSELAAV